MGYCADSVDTDFTVPTDNIAAALESVNKLLTERGERSGFTDLCDAVEEHSSFTQCWEDSKDWHLGYAYDKWVVFSEEILKALAPHAVEGSHVRLVGEDNYLFGFQVVDGRLRHETGDYTWQLDPEQQRLHGAELAGGVS
jgi:hypothetical protein